MVGKELSLRRRMLETYLIPVRVLEVQLLHSVILYDRITHVDASAAKVRAGRIHIRAVEKESSEQDQALAASRRPRTLC
jgi:hypothetical protein